MAQCARWNRPEFQLNSSHVEGLFQLVFVSPLAPAFGCLLEFQASRRLRSHMTNR